MIIILNKGKVLTQKAFAKAREDYETYIKITIDIRNKWVVLGGEYHADAEKRLLKMGSKQTDIWGGGFDIESKQFSVNAMINLRPKVNYSTDILDPKIRRKFLLIAGKVLKEYV